MSSTLKKPKTIYTIAVTKVTRNYEISKTFIES